MVWFGASHAILCPVKMLRPHHLGLGTAGLLYGGIVMMVAACDVSVRASPSVSNVNAIQELHEGFFDAVARRV